MSHPIFSILFCFDRFSELKVKKVDKKPQVQKYMMQLEVDTTIEQRYSIDVEEELSLTRSAMLWRQEPSTIFETNLVEFKKLEPVKLRVVYTGQANLELVSRTRNRTHYTGEFAARGNTVISKDIIRFLMWRLSCYGHKITIKHLAVLTDP